MKMTKLLATGLAASIAAGSLATFASAEELSFNMGQTEGTVKTNNILAYFITDADFLDGLADSGVTGKIAIAHGANVAGARIVVTGKLEGESVSRTTTYECVTDYWNSWYINIITDAVNEGGEINFSAYDEITSIEVYVDKTVTYTDAAAYEGDWGHWGDGQSVIPAKFADGTTGGISVTGSSSILDTLNALLATSNPADKWYDQSSKETKVKYPYLVVTDGYIAHEYVNAADDNTLTRQEIYLLSDADAWNATNGSIGIGDSKDDNQTYGDDKLGTDPEAFAGFASQVADFFNKQTNGTITFKFTAATGSSSSANWGNAGIPSTQVGIKNALNGEWTNEDIALFFNYDQTGSLQATAAVDVAAGEVTFDISEVLDALGGQTKGIIDNIYYGLTKGNDIDMNYDGDTDDMIAFVQGDDHPEKAGGLAVETVTLAYDADAADDDIVEDDADDAEVEDDADEDDDVAVEDDDDDADEDDDVAVEDDADEDDDADVDGADDVVTTPSEDDDANPATGVALAVVPALVAAAAAVVSKKRK